MQARRFYFFSGHVAAATTHSLNLFVGKAFVYQDPYYTACTAASDS